MSEQKDAGDIVERLLDKKWMYWSICAEAADEIERLRAHNERLMQIIAGMEHH